MNSDKKNKDLCKDCNINCCKFVTVEFDTPETKEDYEEIIWMLMHENVTVYIDEDGWNVEFKTLCKALDEEGLCKIYSERPEICKKYNQDGCIKYGYGNFYEHLFKTREDLLKYLKEKNIDLNELD